MSALHIFNLLIFFQEAAADKKRKRDSDEYGKHCIVVNFPFVANRLT